jgi:hypothetical protein
MLGADIVGELGLEFRDLWPENIAAFIDDAVDCRLKPVAYTLALCAKIDELHVGSQKFSGNKRSYQS